MRSRQGDPGVEGVWELLEQRLPFPAAHAALLPTGKVLLLPGGRKNGAANQAPSACLWDWHSGRLRTWNLPADFSLGAHCFLSDGRLVVTGGGKERSAIRLKETYLFDPATEDFLRVNDIPERGPCPTLVELGDGSVLAVGGAGESRIHAYDKTSGWTASSDSELDWPLYPQLTLLEEGSVFYSGQHFGGRTLINPGILGSGGGFEELPPAVRPPDFLIDFREQGETVLLPPAQDQRVMIIGGGSPPTPDVHVIDLSQAEPVLRTSRPMHFGRASFNTVILPDHTLLVCSGIRSDQAGRSAALEAELYEPSRGVWTLGAAAEVPRLEHSSAILLPDGRVLTAGSTDRSGSGELRVELYHPPYLFHGDRPVVDEVPEQIVFGKPFSIKTADSDIRRISLVRPMAVSHGIDSGQRLVDVPFESRGSGVLEAFAPDNPNIAPPGRYLVFLVNHYGTPSLGKWVRLGPSESMEGSFAESHPVSGSHAGPAPQNGARHSWNGAHSAGARPREEPLDPSNDFEDSFALEDPVDFFEPDRPHNQSAHREEGPSESEPLRLLSTEVSRPARRRSAQKPLRPLWSEDATGPHLLEERETGPFPEEPQRPLWTELPAGHSVWDQIPRRPLLEEPALRSLLEESELRSLIDGPTFRSLLDEPAAGAVQAEPAARSPREDSASHLLIDEPANTTWTEEPTASALPQQSVSDTWVESRPEAVWGDVEARPSWLDQPNVPPEELMRRTPAPPPSIDPGSRSPWYSWARPALIIGSAGLLALSMLVDLPPLRTTAAFLFLLLAPGMAIVGLYRPSGWASEVALAVGLSVALETLLTVAMLYFKVWSTERILLTLLGLSLCGATAQLAKAAFGRVDGIREVERWTEAPA
ncbi:MAG: galactose oxidase-like domain-containing protein [Actinomycetota bacterium]